MDDSSQQTSEPTSDPTDETSVPKPRKPWILGSITLLLVIAFGLARVFIIEIEDATNRGLDVLNVITFIVSFIMILIWCGWVILLSRLPWIKRLGIVGVIAGGPIAFLMLFRPVGDGDIGFHRYEPIWRQREELKHEETSGELAKADLSEVSDADFAEYLGKDKQLAKEITIDPEKFADSKVLWKKPIGLGWSAFSARNGFAVTMEQREGNECVSCYEIESGRLVWQTPHPTRHRDKLNMGHVGPRSTPTLHQGNVYAVGANGNLVCLKGEDGSIIWQEDLNELLGIELADGTDRDGYPIQYESNTSLAWGRSGAPLIVDDLCIVPGGGPREGPKATLVAFDKQTGELRWRGGDEMIGYGSPAVATIAGRRQILFVTESLAMGIDPADGVVLWQFDRPGKSDSGSNTSQLTVLSDTDVLTSKGYPDGGAERIQISDVDGNLTPASVWNNPRVLKTKLTTPLIYDGYAYALSGGFMECVDVETGERAWKKRGRFGHGQILRVGTQILIHSEGGTLHLIDASPEKYHEYGSIPTIEGICWNTLCLYDNRLLLRSDLEAMCIELQ